jgi:CRISPR/Cas system-associated exonuclease Cas4 (RecB family)
VAGRLDVAPGRVRLTPLGRISPSLGERLLACELSVAFRLDGRFEFLRRPAPAAALGTISHDLAERVAHGEFDTVGSEALPEALELAWQDALTEAEADLAVAYAVGDPPRPQRWPGYAQTHERLLKHLVADARARRHTARSADGAVLEQQLEPADVPFYGRPDRVERTPAGVEVVDLKTGWTLPSDLKPAHRRQLLAYAYLWHAVHGEWARVASVQRLDGRRLAFDVDPGEAEAVATELVGALRKYNSRVSDGIDPDDLASPSEAACAFCSYRAVCRPFFRHVAPDWPWYRKSVLGRVTGMTSARGLARVDLEVEAGNVEADRASVLNLPRHLAPQPGARVAVVDAIPQRVGADLRLAWDSVVCQWQPSVVTKGGGSP